MKPFPSALPLQTFGSPPLLLSSQILGKTSVQMPTTTPTSISLSIPQLEKSGPLIKEKSSAYLQPDSYYAIPPISLPFFPSLWPSTITRPSPLLLPSSLDSQ